MTVLLVIAMVWLAFALVWFLIMLFYSERPIDDMDRQCAWTDHALRRQYGSGPRWVR